METLPVVDLYPGIAVDGATQQTSVLDMITKNRIDQVLGSGGTPSVVLVIIIKLIGQTMRSFLQIIQI